MVELLYTVSKRATRIRGARSRDFESISQTRPACAMRQVWLVCAIGLLPLYLLMPAALLSSGEGKSGARVSMTRDKLRGASAKRMPKDARLIEAWPG
jgi:hypothetical protein